MNQTELLTQAIMGSLASFLFTGLAFAVLTVIAWWKIFSKAGESGWKSLVPVLNGYTLYKITWKGSMYWLLMLFLVGVCVIGGLSLSPDQISVGLALGALLLFIAIVVMMVVQNVKMAKAFGYGIGFALGLIFFNTIFILVLAFGQSRYVGPQK